MEIIHLCFIFLISAFVCEGYAVHNHPYDVQACQKLGVYSECSNCNTVRVCSSSSTAIASKKCTDKTPLCYNGVCGITPDPDSKPTKYKCTSAGTFPDPFNCTKYFKCTTPSTEVNLKTCPKGYVYSETNEACKQNVTAADCVTISCGVTMGNGLYSPYGASKKYYVLCADVVTPEGGGGNGGETGGENGGEGGGGGGSGRRDAKIAVKSESILVFKCANGTEFDRTPTISACTFKCPRKGMFEYSLDNKLYYDCDGVKPLGELKKCEEGVFIPYLGYCDEVK